MARFYSKCRDNTMFKCLKRSDLIFIFLKAHSRCFLETGWGKSRHWRSHPALFRDRIQSLNTI